MGNLFASIIGLLLSFSMLLTGNGVNESTIAVEDAGLYDVLAYVSNEDRDHCVKVGEVCPLEGFALERRVDSPMQTFALTPMEPVDAIASITISGSYIPAEELAESSFVLVVEFYENIETIGPLALTVQGRDALGTGYALWYDDEESGQPCYQQVINCYVPCENGYTLCLHIYCEGEDDSFFLTEDQIPDFLLRYSDVFTLA